MASQRGRHTSLPHTTNENLISTREPLELRYSSNHWLCWWIVLAEKFPWKKRISPGCSEWTEVAQPSEQPFMARIASRSHCVFSAIDGVTELTSNVKIWGNSRIRPTFINWWRVGRGRDCWSVAVWVYQGEACRWCTLLSRRSNGYWRPTMNS